MSNSTTPQSKKTLESIWRLEKIILDTLDFNDVVQKIVDSTITELGYLDLGYEIVVLCLVNRDQQTLERISISQTKRAKEALEKTSVPFHKIIIPLSEKDNLLIHAINTNETQVCVSWYDILRPTLSEEESLKLQSELEIKNSVILPVRYGNQTIGAMIFSMSKDDSEMTEDERDLLHSFTDVVGLAVQNASIYTDLNQTKKQLESANEDLKALDKLKDEFLSMASHELKSPMNAVKNYLWMSLNKGLENPERLKEYLTVAYEQIQRLTSLVNDLLDVSRIESGRIKLEKTDIDLAKAIKETVEIFETQAKNKNLQLINRVTDPVTVSTDDTKLREILTNLVSNAVKYTLTGSITISTEKKEGFLRINVTDTGSGITPEDQQKLFQKFSRVNASYKGLAAVEGTGLGLYISKQFIEIMGGKIGLDSTIGTGTTFWIELPIA